MSRTILTRISLFTLGGALLGFAYYWFIGCNTGTCVITSNPYISTSYGAVIGLLLGTGGRSGQRSHPDGDNA